MNSYKLLIGCFLLYSCMCSPKPDVVRIDGLTFRNGENFNVSNGIFLILEVVPSTTIKEFSYKTCLTYTKEEPLPNFTNQLDSASYVIVCNKKIGSIQKNTPLPVTCVPQSNFSHKDFLFITSIDPAKLMLDSSYTFTAKCKTSDSLFLERSQTVKINP